MANVVRGRIQLSERGPFSSLNSGAPNSLLESAIREQRGCG